VAAEGGAGGPPGGSGLHGATGFKGGDFGSMGGSLEKLFGSDVMADGSRTFDVSFDGTKGVTFKGEGNFDGLGSNSLGFDCKFGDSSSNNWMDIGLDFSSGATSVVGDSSLKIGICGMVEFSDVDGDGVYTPGTDTVVHTFDKPGFGGFADHSPSDGKFTSLKATSDDEVLGIQMYIAEDGATLDNGVEITANEMKFDIFITNANYTQNGTKLAICTSVSSDKGKGINQQHNGDDLRGITCDSTTGVSTSYFTWADTADSENGTGTVNIIPVVDSATSNIWFTFEMKDGGQPLNITWDPAVGVTGKSTSTTGNGSGSVTFSLLAILAAMVAFLI